MQCCPRGSTQHSTQKIQVMPPEQHLVTPIYIVLHVKKKQEIGTTTNRTNKNNNNETRNNESKTNVYIFGNSMFI